MKEDLDVSSWFVPVVCSILFAGSQAFGAGGPPPYGHSDFRPSGERPIGFMGDGTGFYPGACPPIEFRDGTPTDVDEPNPPHSPVRVQILSDSKSKNILWKTEMPSWANTQPVVVGDRIFTTAEPNLLVAVDAVTGAIQWTQEANAWEIAGVEPGLAKKLQEMWHIANDGIPQFWAMTGRGTVCWEMPPETVKPILSTYREKVQPRLLTALKELDPGGGYDVAASNTLAGMDAYVSGDKGDTFRRNRDSFRDTVHRRIRDLAGTNKVELSVPWSHMVGLAINPPVSDGERVYASLGQGQTVCYDLTGKRLWAVRVALNRDTVNPGNLLLSPLLAGDVLVDMHGGSTLRGLDKLTGKTLWEAPTQGDTPVKGGGYYVGCHRVMSLPGPDGVPVKLIVTTLCNIIRARDGKVLGVVPYEYKPSGGPTMLSVGDVVIKASNGDGFTSPIAAYRLKFSDADHVVCEKLWEKGSSPGYQAQVGAGKWAIMGGSVYDVVTGTVTHQDRDRSIGGYSQTLAGDRYIWTPDGSRRWGGRRADGVTHPFGVASFSEGRLRLVSTRNVLGETVPARVPAMEKYAPELYAIPDYHGQSHGRPAHLVNTDTAVMPHGERLYIRTVNRLYCIGPAVKGTAQDDQKVVGRIRVEKSLAALTLQLTVPSAQYRYEAVKRIADLRLPIADLQKGIPGSQTTVTNQQSVLGILTSMATEDVYEEIRAAAVIALDAADPNGKPGTAAVQATVAKGFTWENGNPCLAQTLALLGPDRAASAVIPLLVKEKDEPTRVAGVRALVDASLRSPQISAAFLDLYQNDPSMRVHRLIAWNLPSWTGDSASAANLRTALNKDRDNETQPGVFWYVANNLPPSDRTAFLVETAKGNSRVRGDAIRLAAEIRPPVAGFGDWMIERGRAGDGDCIRYLGTALGGDSAVPRLVEMLTLPSAVRDAAVALANLKKNELEAATALAKRLPEVVGDGGEVNRTFGAMDSFVGNGDPTVRKALVSGLVAVLGHEKANPGMKRGAAERLGRLKQDGAPALGALRQAATSADKGLADAATAAIKAIEAPPGEVPKK